MNELKKKKLLKKMLKISKKKIIMKTNHQERCIKANKKHIFLNDINDV